MAVTPTTPAVTSQYDVARRRAQQQENSNLQAQKDALARRAAQTGGGVQGALIKQESIASNESARRLADANEGINAQEQQELQRQREVQEGRQYQTSERLGSQDFAGQQAQLGRQFTTSERLGGQGFAAQQAGIQREFQTGERVGGQDYAAQQAALQRRFQTGEREAGQQFATGERIGGQDFAAGQQEKAQTFDQAKFDLQLKQQDDQFQKDFTERQSQFTQNLEEQKRHGLITEEQATEALKQANTQWETEMAENKKTNYINTVISAANSNLPPHISAQINQFLNGLGVQFHTDGTVTLATPANTPVAQDISPIGSAANSSGLTF